jgi:hypothetical protein
MTVINLVPISLINDALISDKRRSLKFSYRYTFTVLVPPGSVGKLAMALIVALALIPRR